MLSNKVSLYDIKDVEGFVIACVKRSGSNAPPEYWDDLIAEGICLLYQMAKNYKPKMNGYDQAGKFSGYAIMWLPKQISQFWHRSQEHHLLAKDPETGKREWTYRLSPVSYEVVASETTSMGTSRQEVTMLRVHQFVEVPTHEVSDG